MYLGVGEGIDSLDFHADLNALKAILPDGTPERPLSSTTERFSFVAEAEQGETTYAYCAWCATALPTRHELEEHFKMPDLRQATEEMPDIVSPDLHWLADLNDYLQDPTHPVLCVPGLDNRLYWAIKEQCAESRDGEPGSTRNFWQLSMHSQRLTLRMKMHSTAAFLSMPNKEGIVLGGTPGQGFNDNSARGYQHG